VGRAERLTASEKLVSLYSTENEEKYSIVERWNRTMNEKMLKYFTANSTRKYVDILDKVVDRYNNTVHSSIGMTPKEATETKNEVKVWRNLYGNYTPQNHMTPKLKVSDKVRITRKKGISEKGYTARWNEEVFTVSEVRYTGPITYRIVGYNNEDSKGSFYEQELQKATQLFRIEKIINKKGNKSLVMWLGYSDKFNSWVDNSDLVAL